MRAINLVKCVQSVREGRLTAEVQSRVWRWDRCRCSDPPPCCPASGGWTAPLSCVSLRPDLLQEEWSRPRSHLQKEKRNKNCETETPKCAFLCYSQMWFPFQLTWLSLHAESFGFGQLQCCDPPLPLHLWAGLQVIRLRAAIRDDEIAWVLHRDIGCGQVYGAPTCVTHLRLGPGRAKGMEIRL